MYVLNSDFLDISQLVCASWSGTYKIGMEGDQLSKYRSSAKTHMNKLKILFIYLFPIRNVHYIRPLGVTVFHPEALVNCTIYIAGFFFIAGTLLLLFISLSITTNLVNNALAVNPSQDFLQNNLGDSDFNIGGKSIFDDSNDVIYCPPVVCRGSGKATFLIVFGDSLFDVGFGIDELCLPSNYTP
ncbi:hypothetical protein SLE2022_082150 [Rubroshorea leprosula]